MAKSKSNKKETIPVEPSASSAEEKKRAAHLRLLKGLKNFVQVDPEDQKDPLGTDLMEVAKENNVNILAFIAPEVGIKVSPTRHISAQIGLFEEFGLQCALTEMKDADPKMYERPLWLLVHSPGGLIPSSYMIAKRLRSAFRDIVAFVPHVAASGGTLIALAANEVVMGEFSRLGPVDPQVPYSPNLESAYILVSANAMERAVDYLEESLRTTSEAEVTVPSRRLAGKLDPILRENWKSELFAVAHYLQEILTKAGYKQKDINRIITQLVYTIYPHDFVVDRDTARGYGINILDEPAKLIHLELMQEWLTKYMLIPEARHYIRFVTVPK